MSRCPRCGSDDVTPVVYTASPRARQSADALPFPVPVDRTSPNFECASCGHAWPDQARLDTVNEIRSYFASMRSE